MSPPPFDGEVISGQWNGPAKDFPKTLTLGIVPQQTPFDIENNWGPLAEYITEETGYTIHIKTASSIPTFEERCAEGRYDIAYMNPYHYVVFAENPQYKAIAKQKDHQIQGIVVMRKDATTTDFEALQGQSLAFPSPAAFAASLLTRAKLHQENIVFTPVYVRSHDSVYQAVASGLYPAGGGVKRTFKATSEEVRNQLQIAWTTNKFTPHALAVHPRVPDEVIEALQDTLGKLDDPIAHEPLLKPLRFKGWEVANDADWDDVRQLELNVLLGTGTP